MHLRQISLQGGGLFSKKPYPAEYIVPPVTGEHIVARDVPLTTRLLLTESKHYEKLLSIVSNCELRLPYHVTNISEK